MASNPQPSGPQPLWPPVVGSAGPQNFAPTISVQFHPVPQQQQAHPFVPAAPQQFRPVGQGISVSNVGIPAQNQQLRFPHMGQPLPPRSGQPGYGPTVPQAVPTPYIQPNGSLTSMPVQTQQNNQPLSNHMPSSTGLGTDISSSYSFAPSSYGQPQNNMNAPSQYQPISQMYASGTPAIGQPSLPSGSQSTFVTLQKHGPDLSVPAADIAATNVKPHDCVQSSSDWIEHTAANGRRYYYNKKTRLSSWEKPEELMTPIERADASTDWKEFTSPDGKKYYYNKVTNKSKWTLPDELKLAREQAKKPAVQDIQLETLAVSQSPVAVAVSVPKLETPSISSSAVSVASSPVTVVPVLSVVNPLPVVSGSPSVSAVPSTAPNNANGVHSLVAVGTPLAVSGNAGVSTIETATTTMSVLENASQPVETSADGAPLQDLEEANKGTVFAGKTATPSEEKVVEAETFMYASKQEAKDAFKALLDSSNVESDWTWEQAMRVIINDKRYGALRTLGERKQAFNEYLIQRKKQEAEERRIKQKKVREDFTKMLEESKDLTSSTKWRDAVTIFENDERFKAVERARDREDIYQNYLDELVKKERAKAHEERKRNVAEYKQFLQSCTFITVKSQWRKVQERLEGDERCRRLDKIDRIEIFQEYIKDLDKEEERQFKIQEEQLRKVARNNRDEFRKLMDEHKTAGVLTAKTEWRNYYTTVKDLPAYAAVSSNTSGATAKDLFEDVVEELEKQYREEKTWIKDAMKLGKIAMTSSWNFEDFKTAVLEDMCCSQISDSNLKLVFDELLEKIKDKEEKEAKKRKILADNFYSLLHSIKEIHASSNWEDCKPLLEDRQEYRSIGEESFKKEIFEGYITDLEDKEWKRAEEKAKKEKERAEKEKRKEKERKEKERERGRDKGGERYKKDDTDGEKVDVKEGRKRDREKDRKHRRRHHSDVSSEKEDKDEPKKPHKHRWHHSDVSSEKEDKDEPKKPHKHRSEKSRKHLVTHESDIDSRHKRHKRGHRHDSYRNGDYEDLEDGEFEEDEVKR